MKAMILAAGRGERMRPLTDSLPKPLLKVAGKPLIEHHLLKLQKIGVTEVVINLSWLGQKIVDYLQDGSNWGIKIYYSWESDGPLETAGGIINALPLLGDQDNGFLVINGDIYVDFDFGDVPELSTKQLAHLWLVDNPEHNPNGDFTLNGTQLALLDSARGEHSFTFSGIGLYRPSFFADYLSNRVMALAPAIKAAIAKQAVTGAKLPGFWTDVGTPQRLQQINRQLADSGEDK